MSRFGTDVRARVAGFVAAALLAAGCSGGGASSASIPVGPTGTPGAVATATPAPATPAPTPTATPTAAPVDVASLPLDVAHAQVAGAFAYDSSKPLDVKDAAPPQTKDGVTVRDIVYASSDGKPVSAWLVVPSGSGPFAAVLYLHWLGQINSKRDEFLEDAKAMAGHGVVSLLPMRFFPGLARPTDWTTDRQSIVTQTIQLRRGLDVLLAQPGVDPKRLGFVGHDYGAMGGAVLAGVDHRLKAAVFMALDATWANWFFQYFGLPEASRTEYDKAMAPFDPIAFLPDVAPTAVYLQFSASDGYVPSDVAAQVSAAAGDAKKVSTYTKVGHDIQDDATATADRQAWLAQELALGS